MTTFPENLTLNDLSEVKKQWDWYRTKLLRNEERVQTHAYLTDELSDEAVAFVDRQGNQPFFLYSGLQRSTHPAASHAEISRPLSSYCGQTSPDVCGHGECCG